MCMISMEECLVCFDETNQFQMFTCGHKVCVYCYPRLRSTKCPVCNQRIELVIPSHAYCTGRLGCCIMISIIVAVMVVRYSNLFTST